MSKYFISRLISLFFLLFLISCSTSELNKTASLKDPGQPKAGDCISCHEDKQVLPGDHADTSDMMLDDCTSCHDPGGELSLLNKIPLSHAHKLKGISCKGCHEDPASPVAAGQEVCLNCHSDTAALIEKTGSLELNPHFSPHEGKTLDCNRCHHQHKSSENYCSRCHGKE